MVVVHYSGRDAEVANKKCLLLTITMVRQHRPIYHVDEALARLVTTLSGSM